MLKYLKRGIHPKENKLTEGSLVKEIQLPEVLILPLVQHIGAPCKPIVKKGDKVNKFQKIAESVQYVSAAIHSPVKGTVKAIEKRLHPNGKEENAIIIRPDSKQPDSEAIERQEITKLKKEDIISIIKDAGIVGLGGAMFPTHVKLNIPKEKKCDMLIINACECEPYITSDSQLIIDKTNEIMIGIEILMKALGVKEAIIGIENNKKRACKKLKQNMPNHIKLKKFHTMYPMGAEKVLIREITDRIVPSGGLPIDVGTVVSNIASAHAVYEAIYKRKPLVERLITVTGDVKNPSNVLAPFGVSYRHLIEQCGGYKGTPAKLFCGGPMMGIAQHTDEVPLIKGNNAIVVFNEERKELKEIPEDECIRCGRCAKNCPMKLTPAVLAKYSKMKKYPQAEANHIMDCMECGCCSYVCPARINIVKHIKDAKKTIIKKKKEENEKKDTNQKKDEKTESEN